MGLTTYGVDQGEVARCMDTGTLALTVLLCDTGVGTGTIAHSSLPRKDFSQPPSLSAFPFAASWQALVRKFRSWGRVTLPASAISLSAQPGFYLPFKGWAGLQAKNPLEQHPPISRRESLQRALDGSWLLLLPSRGY